MNQRTKSDAIRTNIRLLRVLGDIVLCIPIFRYRCNYVIYTVAIVNLRIMRQTRKIVSPANFKNEQVTKQATYLLITVPGRDMES